MQEMGQNRPEMRLLMIDTVNEPQGAFTCRSSTLAIWPILARFLDYYSVFWSKRDLHDLRTPWCVYVSVNDTHNFGQFLVCFVYYYSPFWRPRAISIIYNPWVRLRFCRQHSQFWPILTRFVDYYSSFRGPEAIP